MCVPKGRKRKTSKKRNRKEKKEEEVMKREKIKAYLDKNLDVEEKEKKSESGDRTYGGSASPARLPRC